MKKSLNLGKFANFIYFEISFVVFVLWKMTIPKEIKQ